MSLSRFQVIALVVTTYVVLPIAAMACSVVVAHASLETKVLYSVGLLNFMLFLYRAGHWEFIGVRIRGILAVFAVAFSLVVFLPSPPVSSNAVLLVLLAAANMILAALNVQVARAGRRPEKYLNVALPFGPGDYLVTDGGNGRISRFVNYHYRASVHTAASTNRSMEFAVDIVKADPMGFCSQGIAPASASEYFIFDEPLLSPVTGVVVNVVSDIGDNIPFCREYPYNVGNNVVIRDGNSYIVLGHMRQRSCVVKVGDRVRAGDLIGRVGISGLAPQPHLHIQASYAEDGNYWKGEGIPLLFENWVPVRGKVLKHRFAGERRAQ